MRTTVDLPVELMQAVKMRAAQRGETLKEVFARALAHEVQAPTSHHTARRLELPVIGRDQGPRVTLSNADIQTVLDDEDVERYSR